MDLDRPLPSPITPEARPCWDGLREQKLMLPKCGLSAAGTLVLSTETGS